MLPSGVWACRMILLGWSYWKLQELEQWRSRGALMSSLCARMIIIYVVDVWHGLQKKCVVGNCLQKCSTPGVKKIATSILRIFQPLVFSPPGWNISRSSSQPHNSVSSETRVDGPRTRLLVPQSFPDLVLGHNNTMRTFMLLAIAAAQAFAATSSTIVVESFDKPKHTWESHNDPGLKYEILGLFL